MRALKVFLLALFTAVLGATIIPGARASDWNKKSVVTFATPVEIPGQVLPAGTYVFELADSLSDQHIVRVWSQNQDKLLATIQAIPDYRLKPTSEPVFNFEERPGNSPEALREWFYPGDNYGQEFVYPKRPAAGLVAVAYADVPPMPNDTASNPTDTPAQPASVDQSQATQPQVSPSTDQSQTSQPQTTPSTSPDEANKELPKTASPTPLIALIGMLSLAAALGLRQFAKRVS